VQAIILPDFASLSRYRRPTLEAMRLRKSINPRPAPCCNGGRRDEGAVERQPSAFRVSTTSKLEGWSRRRSARERLWPRVAT